MKYLVLLLLSATALAQAPKPIDPLEQLREAIRVLESEAPVPTYGSPDSSLSRRLEKLNAEMMELHRMAMAIELIKKAIAQIEAEKQKVRVVPTLPAP